ncbi:MAG TPA: hypothetical protein VIR64_00635 [Pseudobacillus sp.]
MFTITFPEAKRVNGSAKHSSIWVPSTFFIINGAAVSTMDRMA